MTTEMEDIILNKEYFELTAEELTTVNELVSSAEEYDEMKWFLASTQQLLVSEKIEATPDLKKNVMDYLHQNEEKRKFWLNSVWVFLWPEEKRFYQRPAFQMSLAALLLIGFIMVYDRPIDEQGMALNDTTISLDDLGTVGDSNEVDRPFVDHLEVVEEDTNVEDVLNRSTFASELDQPAPDLSLPIVESADANGFNLDMDEIPQDGYYKGPIEDLEFADDLDTEDEKIALIGETQSKNNANNNEGIGTGAYRPVSGDKQIDSPHDLDGKDKRNNSREALKKDQLRKGKKNDKKFSRRKDDSSLATEYDGGDVEESEMNMGSESEEEYEYNGIGNNSSSEWSENRLNEPPGVVNNQNTFEVVEPDKEGLDVGRLGDADSLLEKKEQQVIKPHQLHIGATKELKSLFKTLK